MKKVLFVFGTRPEAIKMAPVIIELQKHPEQFTVQICVTAQHRQMLDQVLELFAIVPDFDLDIMKPGQNLTDVTCNVLQGLIPVLAAARPDMVLVHGDTTTTMAASLAAFYAGIPVAHVEAGLRTGNTVIDALLSVVEKMKGDDQLQFEMAERFSFLDASKRLLLVTGHRRENFGEGFENICLALKEITETHSDVVIVYPVHLNPNVQEPVKRILGQGNSKVFLIDPLDYLPFVYLMSRAFLIITDS